MTLIDFLHLNLELLNHSLKMFLHTRVIKETVREKESINLVMEGSSNLEEKEIMEELVKVQTVLQLDLQMKDNVISLKI